MFRERAGVVVEDTVQNTVMTCPDMLAMTFKGLNMWEAYHAMMFPRPMYMFELERRCKAKLPRTHWERAPDNPILEF
jgi:hypothetical protein